MSIVEQIQVLNDKIDDYCSDMGESGLSISELRYRVACLQRDRNVLFIKLKREEKELEQ